ncbi:MAG TPA: translation initiation factor [Synergistaceae bacterium]|nr:translation initiation factor [Synergistaceae bacterium]
MGKNKKNRIDTENPLSPSFRPFEGLFSSGKEEAPEEARERLQEKSRNQERSSFPSPDSSEEFPLLKGTFSLRKETKGRGGKTVTLLSGSHLSPEDAERLARALRKVLGCGSRTEGGMVILQGDLRDRGKLWLLSHGAKKVMVG